MSRTPSWVGPVELVDGAPMLRVPRTKESAALEACVPARLSAAHILVSLPKDGVFAVGSTVEVYPERGALVVRRHPSPDDHLSQHATGAGEEPVPWRAIPSLRRWTVRLGALEFEVTEIPSADVNDSSIAGPVR